MPRSLPLALVMLLAVEGLAAARPRAHRPVHQRRSAVLSLRYRAPPPRLVLEEAVTPPVGPPSLTLSPSYYEVHALRVQNDFLSFQFALPGDNPPVARKPPLLDAPDRRLSFVAPSDAEDPLQQLRELDRLALFRDLLPGAGAGAFVLGMSLFMTAVVGAAHAPAALRVVFDGPLRFGPAVFQGGGMGAGLGATFQ